MPWNPNKEEEKHLDDKFIFLQNKFQIEDSLEIYGRYSDSRYMSNLSFEDRKQFMILFHYHILTCQLKACKWQVRRLLGYKILFY